MSVRKRSWTTSKGEKKECWIVDYVDQKGERRGKNFTRKKDADAYHARVVVDVSKGIHTPDAMSPTIAEAGELWITAGEVDKLERSTLEAYSRHLRLHIVPHLGRTKLSQLSMAVVCQFEDKLKLAGMSPAMVKKVRGSLSMLVGHAMERSLVSRNVLRELPRTKKRRRAQKRLQGKLKVGKDIPEPGEIAAIQAALQGRWRPLLLTAIFTGLRASELRGLPWRNVKFEEGKIEVAQRADRYNKIGPPKSEAGERTVPLPPLVLNALRQWKEDCPKSEQDLVFPNHRGGILRRDYIVEWGLKPVQVKAGVVDAEGKAKYTGLHALRHFFASWCLNRKAKGGRELPPKVVQEWLGHSTIAMTLDTYAHCFADGGDDQELADAEQTLINATRTQHGRN